MGRAAGREAETMVVGGARRPRMQRAREGSTGVSGRRARAKCTLNMWFMTVTLDVSKLSGWLNAFAVCRVERRAYDVGRGAGREAGRLVGRGGRACSVQGKARLESGRRAQAERT